MNDSTAYGGKGAAATSGVGLRRTMMDTAGCGGRGAVPTTAEIALVDMKRGGAERGWSGVGAATVVDSRRTGTGTAACTRMAEAAAATAAVPVMTGGSATCIGMGEAAVATVGLSRKTSKRAAFVDVEEARAPSAVATRRRSGAECAAMDRASAATAPVKMDGSAAFQGMPGATAATTILLGSEGAAAVTYALAFTVKARRSAACIEVGGVAAASAVVLVAVSSAVPRGIAEAAAATGALLGTGAAAAAPSALTLPIRRRRPAT